MPTLPEIREIGPAERVFSRPSWADPTFLMMTSQVQWQDIVCAPGVINTLAVPDPKRVAIGFLVGATGLGPCNVGPFEDADEFFFANVTGPNSTIYTIFNYGPFVCGQWYGFPAGASTVRVHTWTIQPGGM